MGASVADVAEPAVLGPLLGRARECAALDAALDEAVAGRAVTVAVTGDAGAGKTALCGYVAGRAESRGARVLSTTCVEGESDLALAGLSALLRPVVHLAARRPAGQQHAVRAACGLVDAASSDRFALGAATLGVLAAAAEERPLVLVVDDVHWLDDATRDALSFAVRRLGVDAVLVVLAGRPGRGAPALESVARRLALGGLAPDDLAAMLERAGLPLHREVVGPVHEATGGLPLPALETAAALSPPQRSGSDLLPDPLPVGRAVLDGYRARLDELPAPARRALAVLAAAGSAPPEVLQRAWADLALDVDDLGAAEDAGMVGVTDGRMHIAHPLLRAAVFAHCSPSTRREVHAALARASADDPERHARHLASCASGPGDELAGALATAADRVRRRAGPAAAAPLLSRAADATPPGAVRDERLLAAAEALAAAGRPDDAHRIARALADSAAEPSIRADATLVLLSSSVWRADSLEMCRAAIAEAERIAPDDPGRAARALFMASTTATGHGALHGAFTLAERGHRLAGSAGEPALESAARGQYAMALVLLGRHREAAALLDGAWSVSAGPHEVHALQLPATLQTLVRLDWMPQADTLAGDLLAVCARGEAPSTKAYVLAVTTEVRWWQGRWAEALSSGEEAVTLARETGQDVLGWYTAVVGARTLAALGRDDAVRAEVDRVLTAAGAHAFLPLWVYGPAALGLLELGRGQHAAAAGHLLAAEAARQKTGLQDPRTVPFGPDLVEALVRHGDTAAACAALEDLDARLSTAATPWGLAVTDRCRALLTDDPDHADALFARAVSHHHADGAPFDLARTQLCRGELRRRHGRVREARAPLREALDVFHGLHATPWEARAAAELRATGEDPSPATARTVPMDALSPQELQCALAVGRGMTNREAAAALFISPKTVEYHLRKVYAKLGLRSRTQLVRLLATADPVRG